MSADRRRAGGGIRRCCLNSSGGEVEALLRRGSRWGDQGWLSRQADAFEVAAYRGRLGERCDDAHAPSKPYHSIIVTSDQPLVVLTGMRP